MIAIFSASSFLIATMRGDRREIKLKVPVEELAGFSQACSRPPLGALAVPLRLAWACALQSWWGSARHLLLSYDILRTTLKCFYYYVPGIW